MLCEDIWLLYRAHFVNCACAARAQETLLFLKPVQTGFPADCDSRLLVSAASASPQQSGWPPGARQAHCGISRSHVHTHLHLDSRSDRQCHAASKCLPAQTRMVNGASPWPETPLKAHGGSHFS